MRTQIEHKKALTTALERADNEITSYREVLEEASTLKVALMKEIEDDKAETEKSCRGGKKIGRKRVGAFVKEAKAERQAEELAEEVKKQEVIVEKVEEEKNIIEETQARVTEQLDTFRDSATMLSKRLSQRMLDKSSDIQIDRISNGYLFDRDASNGVRPEMKNKKCLKKPKSIDVPRKRQENGWWQRKAYSY